MPAFTNRPINKCRDRPNCTSVEHGDLVCAAIVRGSNEEAICYIRHLCCSFSSVLDSDGLCALHVASICGQNKVILYLLANGASVNKQHSKTGNTALHFAVMYGNIDSAHLLLNLGADINIVNARGRSPLVYLSQHQPFKGNHFFKNGVKLQLYSWGNNDNYNLGLAKRYSGTQPEFVDINFKDSGDEIREISANTYHTLFRSMKGRVYACGHGRGGRLGIDVRSPVIIPEIIRTFKLKVINVCAAVDHSVFLTENKQVWTCGKNSYRQLGFSPPPDCLYDPKPLESWFASHPTHRVIGIGAGAYHTVFWTEMEIMTFGLNGGQLGHPANHDNPFIEIPCRVTSPRSLFLKFLETEETIMRVYVGDAAILFCSSGGNVFIITNYKVHRLLSENRHKHLVSTYIKQIACIGGTLDTKVKSWNDKYLSNYKPSDIIVAILNIENRLLIWTMKSSDQALLSVDPHWSKPNIFYFSLNSKDLNFVNMNYQCFKVDVLHSASLRKTNSKDPEIFAPRCSFLPFLCRPFYVFSDPQGKSNFALQFSSDIFSVEKNRIFCKSSFKEDFSQLYSKISGIDSLCDVEIETKRESLFCHSFLLSYHSDFLYNKIIEQLNGADAGMRVHLNIGTIEYESLLVILQFLYTEAPSPLIPDELCDEDADWFTNEALLSPPINEKMAEETKSSLTSYQKNVLNAARLLGLDILTYNKEGFLEFAPIADEAKRKASDLLQPGIFLRRRHPKLWDVWFKCEGAEKLLGAHKCALVARCQYFDIYFSSRWGDAATGPGVIRVSASYAALKAVLDYLYTDSGAHMTHFQVELLCEVLTLSNHYLITRLHEICQNFISKRITLKNCLDLLQFCHVFHAEQLLKSVYEFLTFNILHFFPLRSFKGCKREYILKFAEEYKRLIYFPTQELVSSPNAQKEDLGRFKSIHDFYNDIDDVTDADLSHERLSGSCLRIDSYPEHPTPSELQCLDKDVSFIDDDTPDDWLDHIATVKLNSGEERREDIRRHQRANRKPEVGRRRRRTSSSLTSSDSNSEGEGLNETYEPQFSFDDLTEKEAPHKEEEEWHLVARRSLEGCSEEGIIERGNMSSLCDDETAVPSLDHIHFPSLQESFGMEASSPRKESSGTTSQSKKQSHSGASRRGLPRSSSLEDAATETGLNLLAFLKTEVKKKRAKEGRLVTQQQPASPDSSQNTKEKGWNIPKLASEQGQGRSSWDLSLTKSLSFGSPPEVSFSAIMEDEVAKSRSLSKALNKPLQLIQLEERAMAELCEFYGGANNPDELVTVARVTPLAAADPLWKK